MDVQEMPASDAEALVGGSADAAVQPRRTKVGLWAVALAACVATVMLFQWTHSGREDSSSSPPGLRATGSLSDVVGLVSTDTYARMIGAVNDQRALHGLNTLCYNHKLNLAAQAHAEDMSLHDTLSHTGSDGSDPGGRLHRIGYEWSTYAENAALGYTSPEQVVQAWMNSPGHRANILKQGISHFGMGVKAPPGDTLWLSWVQVFGAAGNEGCP